VAVLNCEICQQWEKHFDFYPHRQVTMVENIKGMEQSLPEEPKPRIGFAVDENGM